MNKARNILSTALCAIALSLTCPHGAMGAVAVNKDLGDAITMSYPGWLEVHPKEEQHLYMGLVRRVKAAFERNSEVDRVSDIRLHVSLVDTLDPNERQSARGTELPLMIRTLAASGPSRPDRVVSIDYDRRRDCLVVTVLAQPSVNPSQELGVEHSAWFDRALLEQFWLAMNYRKYRFEQMAADPAGAMKAMLKTVVENDPGAHPSTDIAAVEIGLQVLNRETNGRYLRSLGTIVRAHRARSIKQFVRSVTDGELARLKGLFPAPATTGVEKYRKRLYMTDLGVCWLFGQDIDPIQRWAKLSYVPDQVRAVLE